MADRFNPASVYEVLASGNGTRVEGLLQQVYLDIVGMATKDDHMRSVTFHLKVEYDRKNRPMARITDTSSKGDKDDLEGSNWVSHENDRTRFDAVRVATKNLGEFDKKEKDLTDLEDALKDLSDEQFGHQYYDDRRVTVYNLPVPDPRGVLSPCIMLTNDLLHTTICWKEVILDGYKTLAVAHVNASGFRYKKFHDMVKQHGTLRVLARGSEYRREPVFEEGPIDGCWGPRDYFAHDLSGRQRSERLLPGGSCVVIGVWDKASKS
jgi:hypothetical protein